MSLSQSSIFARFYRSPWSRYVGILAYIGLVVGVIYVFFADWAYDDPFITYRYARNLVNGIGFVYNAGERVLSTTTPLYVFVLAALSPLSLDLPQMSVLFGAFCLACGGLLIWSLAQSSRLSYAGWAGLVLYPSFPLLIATLGSEVPFYLMLCLAAIASYAYRRYSLAAICVALATLARPDGALLALLLAVHYLIYVRKPFPWGALAWFAAITLPWLIFAWLYFGSPIPVTLAAKQYQGSMAISQRFAAGLQTTLTPFLRRPYFWLEAFLAIAGLAFSFRFGRRYWLLWAWTLLYFASYSLLGVSRYFWYYAPLVPGFVAAVGVGVAALRAQVVSLGRPFSQAGNLVAGLILLLLFLGQSQSLQQQAITADLRYPVYKSVGKWLADKTPPGSSVGALEIGIIGYYADRPVVDFAGLVQPDVAPQLKGSNTYEEAAKWAIKHYRPNYLVLQDNMFSNLEAGYVRRKCHKVQNFPATQGQYSQPISIYACGSSD
jgi:hypothetical protein